jgi:hypothetical protein
VELHFRSPVRLHSVLLTLSSQRRMREKRKLGAAIDTTSGGGGGINYGYEVPRQCPLVLLVRCLELEKVGAEARLYNI